MAAADHPNPQKLGLFFSAFFCGFEFSLSSVKLLRVAVPSQLRVSLHAWPLPWRFKNALTHDENLSQSDRTNPFQCDVPEQRQLCCLPILARAPVLGMSLRLCWWSIFFDFGLEVEMSSYACTNHVRYTLKQLHFGEIGMFRVLVAALSNPSNQKVQLFPITTSTCCLFMCSSRLRKKSSCAVSKPGRSWKCALLVRNISELGGVKTTIVPVQRTLCRVGQTAEWSQSSLRLWEFKRSYSARTHSSHKRAETLSYMIIWAPGPTPLPLCLPWSSDFRFVWLSLQACPNFDFTFARKRGRANFFFYKKTTTETTTRLEMPWR